MAQPNQVTLTCTIPTCSSPTCPTCNCEGCCDSCKCCNCNCGDCDCTKCCSCDCTKCCNCDCDWSVCSCRACLDQCSKAQSFGECLGALFFPCAAGSSLCRQSMQCDRETWDSVPLWLALCTCQCLCTNRRCCDPQDVPGSGLSFRDLFRPVHEWTRRPQADVKDQSQAHGPGSLGDAVSEGSQTHPPDAAHMRAVPRIPPSHKMQESRLPHPTAPQNHAPGGGLLTAYQCCGVAQWNIHGLQAAVEHGDISLPSMASFLALGMLVLQGFLVHSSWNAPCDPENHWIRWFLVSNILFNIAYIFYLCWIFLFPGVQCTYCLDSFCSDDLRNRLLCWIFCSILGWHVFLCVSIFRSSECIRYEYFAIIASVLAVSVLCDLIYLFYFFYLIYYKHAPSKDSVSKPTQP